MRLARLSLAALSLFTAVACSADATAPEFDPSENGAPARISPAGPLLNSQTFGSGAKATQDTVVNTSSSQSGGADPS